MASFKKEAQINFEQYKELLEYMTKNILEGSVSASLEEEESYEKDNIIAHCLAFERYAYLGGNRVSLTLSSVYSNNNAVIFLVATGGSQAAFFKINTYSEENFLELAVQYLEEYLNWL